ncbi:hypothetical protein RQP46_009011 [Phenoliferia psychrophenolica]
MAPKSLAGDSQYDYDSQWDQDAGSSIDDDSHSGDSGAPANSTFSQDVSGGRFLQAADRAMGTLEGLHRQPASAWKRALKHKSGTVVSVTKESSSTGPGKGGRYYKAPVFKGELDIMGFEPVAVFGVVGTRKLWDDWYKEGNLVQNLSDNSSLTYTCMKGITGSSTRDLSLVEQVKGTGQGTILFASTSVVSPIVPRVSGRVRASIALNGWVLEPIPGGTKITYYLHVDVKTFVPAFAAMKYLARRPTCIAKIAEYLKVNGPPPMAGVEASPPASTRNARNSNGGGGGGGDDKEFVPRRRRDSSVSRRSAHPSIAGALPPTVEPNEDATSYADIQKAHKQLKQQLASSPNEWSHYVDHEDNAFWTKKRDGEDLPVVKGEAIIEGVTTEMVLGTIKNSAARKVWDVRYAGTKHVSLDNGFDQGVYVESHKGIFPNLGARHYVVATGVDRADLSTDHSTVSLVSRSTKAKVSGPADSTKGQLDLAGWVLSPHTATSVRIQHVALVSPSSKELPSSLGKVLISEIATAPARLAEFIGTHGHAPSFVRWGEGPAQLLSGEDGDITKGQVTFRVGGDGDGTMKGGEQKSWLQWSDKMYERGIEIDVEPKGAATIAKVDGIERTAEFVWSDDVKEGVVKVILRRAEGDGAEDLFVGGEFLDSTVAMAKGANVSRRSKKAVIVKDDSDDSPPPAPRARSAAPAAAPATNGSSKTNGYTAAAAGAGAAVAAAATVAAVAPARRAVVAPAAAKEVAAPVAAAPVQQQQQQVAMMQPGSIPENACLIISKDLYFTRQQVVFMAGVVAVSFAWGKIA